LRHKQQTLAHFGRARHAVCERKAQDLAQQVRWITDVLA
jgi:tRNA (adenine22-N1)-methyltransferase